MAGFKKSGHNFGKKAIMKTNTKGVLYLINTIILFSTYEAVSITLVDKANPFQINFIRFFIGGIILLIFLLFKREMHINARELFWVAVIGIVNVAMSMNLIQLSLYASGAKASVVAVIFSSNPIFVCIFAALIDKEKINLIKLTGLIIGIAGIFIISAEKPGWDISDYKSPILALLSAVLYGLYTVLGRRVSVKIGSLKMNSYSFIIGSLILLPFLVFFRIPVIKFDYTGIWQVVYLSVFVTGLAYLTYFKGLSIAGSGKGSLVFFAKPVLASAIAIIFLKEHLSVNLLAGTVLIVLSILVVINSEKIDGKIRGLHI